MTASIMARYVDALKRELAEYDRVIKAESSRLDDLRVRRTEIAAQLERIKI